MATVVDICNLALGELRASPIVNLTDKNPRAEACNAFYDIDRQQVLRDHCWNFATKRSAVITADVATPAFGYSYSHTLPTDFIKLVGIYADSTIEPITSDDYTIEGGKILSNYDEIYLRYIYNNEDTTLFDPLFIKVLSLRLASSIAAQITGNASLKGEMYQLYEEALNKAKIADGQDRPPTVKMNTRLSSARRIIYRRGI